MRKILFIGAPGSGKGSYASALTKYGFIHISTGDLMRDAWKRNDPLLTKYKESVEKGNLLPDEVVFSMVEKAVKSLGNSYQGYILDGAVRNIDQAKLGFSKKLFDEVVFFEVSQATAEKRINNRLKISSEKRKDDTPEAIKQRFKIFNEANKPILEFLKKNIKNFYTIDGSKTIDEVVEDIVKRLKIK